VVEIWTPDLGSKVGADDKWGRQLLVVVLEGLFLPSSGISTWAAVFSIPQLAQHSDLWALAVEAPLAVLGLLVEKASQVFYTGVVGLPPPSQLAAR
jgi:hypothetical protein